jgi:HD-GYP domain-containing protein (c-di-GMP phosphodiesterase class II)
VVAALLKEFDAHNNSADFGAVFMGPTDTGAYELERSFGVEGKQGFATLAKSRLFGMMAEREMGDIVNNLLGSPLWEGEPANFQSLLWLPLASHGEKIGLLVLASKNAEGFSAADLKRAQTLSSVAATALRNAQLYVAEQKMFQSFVRVIAGTIDAKSPYTAGHCRRVPEIALLLAESAHQSDRPAFAAFRLTEDDRNAIEIAAMLHDCGKVVTPEWVIDKASKLDSIVNRIDLLSLRFELLRRDAAMQCCQELNQGADPALAETTKQLRLQQINDDFVFLNHCNQGAEFVTQNDLDRINHIARQRWIDSAGDAYPLLTEDEVFNLATQRGTLNPKERKIIEDHARHTINMLSQIMFPASLRNVTEYAGGHHERMDGGGYPQGLKGDQLSIPARIMAIADIFEALTAPDRPYRKPGALNWALDVMQRMKQDHHIDSDLFDLFLSEKIYLTYAQKHLSAGQIDAAHVQASLNQQES